MRHNTLILLTLFHVSRCVEPYDRLKNYRPSGCHRSAYQERKYTVGKIITGGKSIQSQNQYLKNQVQRSSVAGGHHEN